MSDTLTEAERKELREFAATTPYSFDEIRWAYINSRKRIDRVKVAVDLACSSLVDMQEVIWFLRREDGI